ncbi:MAG: glycogen synthase [Candidatus Saccharimonadia bacterium]
MATQNQNKGPLKILFVSAEVAPISYVGGLSQVSYFLPRALLKRGVDIRIFTPRYGNFNEQLMPHLVPVIPSMKVPTGEPAEGTHPRELEVSVKLLGKRKATEPMIYLLENLEYYQHRANVYQYDDDHIRFGLLSRATIEFLKSGVFVPDIIHANDWHTAYLLDHLRTDHAEDPILNKIATILSVHNTYQGNFDFQHAAEVDFDNGTSPLQPLFDERFQKQNALKRGVIHADLINTVSSTYANELLTEEHGRGLHNLFREMRGKMYGVINGLDYTDFDPKTDRIIRHNYNFQHLDQRAKNKLELQRQFNLPESPNTPILAISGRMTEQKGLDLVIDIIDFVLTELDCQLVVLGQGREEYRKFFSELGQKYPDRVGTHLRSDFTLPRMIFAGADIMLMPSKFEPGGIVAIEAMRYGCVPVVRATGGLADVVKDFEPMSGTGNGFTFKRYHSTSLLVAIVRALEVYKNQPAWKRLVRQAMREDFSWDKTAKEYLDLYSRAQEFRKVALKPNPPMAFKQMIR